MEGGGEGTKQSLQSPLLAPGYHDTSLEEAGGCGGADGSVEVVGRARKGEVVLAEAKRVVWLAGPLVSTSVLQYCINVISVMFVGHLGELALSGAAMASSFAGVTGFSLLLGMGSAMDTFCGQAFGAGQYHMLGVHMQRAMLVLTLISIPVAFIWANTGNFLLLLGQDPEISSEAGLYARWMIPSLFAYGLLQCYVRYLQAQNLVFPMMISSGITTVFHVLICWILVFKSNLGNKGAALANAISYWINVLLLATYVKFSPACKKTWTGFSKEALNDVLIYIKLAVPSAVMVCLEFWSFEFVVLLSGLLPDPTLETSVLSISLNTSTVVFMIPFGLGAAVSTRVSNELGAGNSQGAQLAVCVAIFMVIMEGLTLGLVMILVHTIWGHLYTNDEKVVESVAKIMPLIAISHLMDGVQSVLSGTARGCGWQRIGAFINLGAYHIVGIPSAVLFAFVLHFGGKGLWMGIICGLCMQVSLLTVITLRTDWKKEEQVPYIISSIFLHRLLQPGIYHSAALRATILDHRKYLTDFEFQSLNVASLKKEIFSIIESEGVAVNPISMFHYWKNFCAQFFRHWSEANTAYCLFVDSSNGSIGLIRKGSVSLFRNLEHFELLIYGSYDEICYSNDADKILPHSDLDRDIFFDVLKCMGNITHQLGRAASAAIFMSIINQEVFSFDDIVSHLVKILETGYCSPITTSLTSQIGVDATWEKRQAGHRSHRKFAVEMMLSLRELHAKAITWERVLNIVEKYLHSLIPKCLQSVDTEPCFNINSSLLVQAASQMAKVILESSVDILLLLRYLVNINMQARDARNRIHHSSIPVDMVQSKDTAEEYYC